MLYNEPLSQHPPEVEFYKTYFNTSPTDCENYGYKNTYDNETDIYIIAFNNPFLVEYQIKTLKTFFKTPHNIIIVDNNNWLYKECSSEFLKICQKENVVYLKAPNNYYQLTDSFDSSMKLGTTMSWIFHNCIKIRETKYFGFLDHDCMLIKNLNIIPYLNTNGMYGRVCRGTISDAFNLHVTTNFFRFDYVKNLPLDFRASHKYQLDTGGANYDVIYNKHNPEQFDLHLITHRYAEHDVNRKDSVQHYEIIDRCWFHIAASTHDQLVNDGAFKLIYAKGYLDGILQTNIYLP